MMKKKTMILAGLFAMLAACSSTDKAGETTGSILRAPVDFFSGLGRGITGQGHMPLRQFDQDWEKGGSDPVFWEEDEKFFAEVIR